MRTGLLVLLVALVVVPAQGQEEGLLSSEAAPPASAPVGFSASPVAWDGRTVSAYGAGHEALGVEAVGAAADTSQIVLTGGFFRADRFTYGAGEPQKVFTMTGLTPQLRNALRPHPEALQEANDAGTYKAISLVGQAGFLIGCVISGFQSGISISSGGLESPDYGTPIGLMIGGAVVSSVGNMLARARVKEGVRIFNEQQGGGEGLTQSSAPGSSVEVASLTGSSRERPAGLESWYTYWGLGWANPGYSEGVDQSVELLRDTPGVSNFALNLDLLGFYFPVGGHKMVVGGIINGAAERFAVEGSSFQVNQYLYAPSVMYFVNDHIGRGFFARGDVGLARVVVVSDDSLGDAVAASGWGFLLGGGYAFPISSGTRLLLNANYARRSVEGEGYSAFSLSLGGLF